MRHLLALLLFLAIAFSVAVLLACLVSAAQADTCPAPVRYLPPVALPPRRYAPPVEHHAPVADVPHVVSYIVKPVDVFIFSGPPLAITPAPPAPTTSAPGIAPGVAPTVARPALSAEAARVLADDEAAAPGPRVRGYAPGAVRLAPPLSPAANPASDVTRLAAGLRPSCAECHSAPRGKGGVMLYNESSALAPNVGWQAIHQAITSGRMPPPGRAGPAADVVAGIGRMAGR